MGSPERWKASVKDGYIRDQNGKILRPVMMIKRTSITNEEPLTLNRHLTYQIQQKYSAKNRYDRVDILSKMMEPPVKEVYNIVMPDKVTIMYDCVVWTNKVEQMNEVVEKMNFSTHDYWGDPKRYRFRTEINDYANHVDSPNEEDRLVKTTFSITVYGRLLPEFFEDGSPTTIRRLTPRKLVLGENISTPSSMPTSPISQNNLDVRFVDPNKNRPIKK